MKKFCALIITLVLIAACAQAETWDMSMGKTMMHHHIMFDKAPGALAVAMGNAGWNMADLKCGAIRQTRGQHDTITAEVALSAMRTETGHTLVAAWDGGDGWHVLELGESMLLPERDFRIFFREGETSPIWVEYEPMHGVTERYGFWIGFGSQPELWTLEGYERENADGTGLKIDASYMALGLRVSEIGAPFESARDYPANWVGRIAWLDVLADFPTNEEAARTLAESSWQALDGSDLVMLYANVNLRERPTTASRSLGRYADGTLARVIGQEPGNNEPWYHVSIGGVEGYVSGTYVRQPREAFYNEALWHGPLRMGRMKQPGALRVSPGGQEACALDAGSLVYIMGTRDDGWLHVSPAQDPPHWEMDPGALCGYVPADELEIGSAVTLGVR